MTILLIKPQWGEKVLGGKKSWEIRGTTTKKRGRIALAFSGTGMKYGEVTLTDAIPLTKELWEQNMDKHCVNDTWENVCKRYAHPYAWVLTEPETYAQPVGYIHPAGAVIWVNE